MDREDMTLNQTLNKPKQRKTDSEMKGEMKPAFLSQCQNSKGAHGLQIEAKVRWSQGLVLCSERRLMYVSRADHRRRPLVGRGLEGTNDGAGLGEARARTQII
jgi:hypothetical protein